MNTLNGRVAVVTGAAGGIGLAMAHQFAKEGMKLVIADVDASALSVAFDNLRAGGAIVLAVPTDVSSPAQVEALADAAYAEYGGVHVLCNNAGVATPALRSKAWDGRMSDWEWIFQVNFMGVLHGVRAFVPRMLAGGDEGHVVNTASVAGLIAAGSPYFVSKHAVVCLTEGLYKDLKGIEAKVSASVLCPGLIRTAIVDAERNRPPQYGPATDLAAVSVAKRAMANEFRAALKAGYEPDLVAALVVDGIRRDHFYIVPAQQHLQETIDFRMRDILDRRNPTLLDQTVLLTPDPSTASLSN